MVHVGYRLNPPPGWPPVPDGFVPAPGWQPDPSWPAPPPGWQLWLPDDGSFAPSSASAIPSPAPASATPFAAPSPAAAPSPSAYPADGITAPNGGAGPYGAGASPYPSGANQYGANQYGATWPPPSQGVSGLAIASFVLGLLGAFLLTAVLSVILGIAAMAEIRRSGQRGRGLAIAGFALSGVWVAAIVGLIVIGAVTGGSNGNNPPSASAGSAGHSPATTQASTPASVNVFSLPVGTCFDNPSGNLFSINSVTPIACTKAHNAQVFAQFNVKGTSFPGTAAMERRADNGCNARITGHLDQSKVTSAMSLHFIFPRQLAWDSGQRRISCLVVDASRDLTSSLLARSGSG